MESHATITGDTFRALNEQLDHRELVELLLSVVRENVDTLYSTGTLDLEAEPVVLSVPATDRYFLLPMLSTWSDVFAVPHAYDGEERRAHARLEVIKSPTPYVWIIGRTQTNGRPTTRTFTRCRMVTS